MPMSARNVKLGTRNPELGTRNPTRSVLELSDELLKAGFGVAKEHARVVFEEEGILNTRKARCHGPFADNDRSGTVYLNHRHPVD